jgi:hypothetical protein
MRFRHMVVDFFFLSFCSVLPSSVSPHGGQAQCSVCHSARVCWYGNFSCLYYAAFRHAFSALCLLTGAASWLRVAAYVSAGMSGACTLAVLLYSFASGSGARTAGKR